MNHPPEFNAVQLKSAPGALAEQIIKQIQDGKLTPGTLLPSQRELAKIFKVGLGSVREAIKILDVMGYLEVIRGKGTFVSKSLAKSEKKQVSQLDKVLEAVSLADLMKAREIVECGAARLAANFADAESISRLKAVTGNMEASFDDTEMFFDLDFSFHELVAEACNNKALFEIIKMLVDQTHKHLNFMTDSLRLAIPGNIERAVSTARDVVAFIEAGDVNGAAQAMEVHINTVNYELDKKLTSIKE
jgi:GntR family transcriptional repressor for pyruvate dehydrogenase complex